MIVSLLDNYIADTYVWCNVEHVKLNADETELLWFGSASQLRQLPSQTSTIHVNQCAIKPVTVIQELGMWFPHMWFDAELSKCSHISHEAQICFCHQHQLRAVRNGQLATATSQQGWLQHLSCHVWTTVTPCWSASPSRRGTYASGS